MADDNTEISYAARATIEVYSEHVFFVNGYILLSRCRLIANRLESPFRFVLAMVDVIARE